MEGGNGSTRRALLAGIAGATASLSGCFYYAPRDPGNGGPTSRGDWNGSGGGTAGERFYREEPPARTGPSINATDYGSLREAEEAVPEGGTLYLPRGSYRGPLPITTDHTTIDGDGAVIEQTGRENWALGSSSPRRSSETSLRQPIAGGGAEQDGVTSDVGDVVIAVDDSSSFAAGDDIYIVEQARPYGDPRSGGAKGPDVTEEFRTVVGVDHGSNTIQIHHPMFLPFPAENQTRVGHVEWTAEDVRVSGLTIRGNGGDGTHVVEFAGLKHGWIDNLRIENSPNASLAITDCYRTRTHKIECLGGEGYGITIRGSVHTYCSETMGDGIVNYTVRAGSSTTDVFADGVYGRNYQSSPSPVCASHWGGFYVVYQNVHAQDQLARYRTRQMIIDGFETSDCSSIEIVFSQRPFDVLVRNGSIGNYPSDANEAIFYFRLRGDSQAGGGNRFGNERARNIRIADVTVEQLGSYGPEDIGRFDPNAIIDGLHFQRVTYGGQPLTTSDVEAWPGYSPDRITNLVVE